MKLQACDEVDHITLLLMMAEYGSYQIANSSSNKIHKGDNLQIVKINTPTIDLIELTHDCSISTRGNKL